MKKLELEKLGLVEMTELEMRETYGGQLPLWAWLAWAAAVVVSVITELL